MIKRTTADIISDVLVAHASDAMRREVAERLTELQDEVSSFRWVAAKSNGVVGLREDGLAMPWPEVFRLYVVGAS